MNRNRRPWTDGPSGTAVRIAILLNVLGLPLGGAPATAAGGEWVDARSGQWNARRLAAEDPPAEAPAPDRRTIMDAMDRGLLYLSRTQSHDGAWDAPALTQSAGITAIAALAFLARGHHPERGPYADCLARITDFLCRHADANGILATPGGGPVMYQHGFATLAVAELYGMSRDERLEAVLKQAVRGIIAAQITDPNHRQYGGWRYTPEPHDADLSVTVVQLMALKAALNAGIPVPAETLDAGIRYVRGRSFKNGAFSYEWGYDATLATSAAGVFSLQLSGHGDAPEAIQGVAYVLALSPLADVSGQDGPSRGSFFYGIHYAAQALFHGDEAAFSDWMPGVEALLLQMQAGDGSWPAGGRESGAGPAYSTAMACLTLAIRCHYLPIFQR